MSEWLLVTSVQIHAAQAANLIVLRTSACRSMLCCWLALTQLGMARKVCAKWDADPGILTSFELLCAPLAAAMGKKPATPTRTVAAELAAHPVVLALTAAQERLGTLLKDMVGVKVGF